MKLTAATFILAALVVVGCLYSGQWPAPASAGPLLDKFPQKWIPADSKEARELPRVPDSKLLEAGKLMEESGNCEGAIDLYLLFLVEGVSVEIETTRAEMLIRLLHMPTRKGCPAEQIGRVLRLPQHLKWVKGYIDSLETSLPAAELKEASACSAGEGPECAKARNWPDFARSEIAGFQAALGLKYQVGAGVSQDITEAAWWYYQSVLSWGKATDSVRAGRVTAQLRGLADMGNGAAKEYLLELEKRQRAEARSRIEGMEQEYSPAPGSRGGQLVSDGQIK